MRRIFLIPMFLLLCSGLLAGEQPVVAVYHFENETSGVNKLPSSVLINIEEKLRSELIKTEEFQVVNQDKMDILIAQAKEESFGSERDPKYRIKLGQKMSARYIVVGKVRNCNQKYTLFAEMIDIQLGISTGSGNADFTNDKESCDKAANNIVVQLVAPRDTKYCEYAKRENSIEAWEDYLQSFPKGICAAEAKGRIRTLKQEADEQRQSCDASPVIFPCKDRKTKYMWSERYYKKKTWKEAKDYCYYLNEGDFSGWHLPSLTELKTIIRKDQSKFGDVEWLWSSKSKDEENVWGIDFSSGRQTAQEKESIQYVRCVR